MDRNCSVSHSESGMECTSNGSVTLLSVSNLYTDSSATAVNISGAVSSSANMSTADNRCHMIYPTSHVSGYANQTVSSFTSVIQDNVSTTHDSIRHMDGSGSRFSELPLTFNVKQESLTDSPPLRSHSVHSLPSNLAPAFPLIKSTGVTNPERFSVKKSDTSDGTELITRDQLIDRPDLRRTYCTPTSIPQSSGYVTCSSTDPNHPMFIPSQLMGPLRSNNTQLSVFTTHCAGLSPLSLTSQGLISSRHATLSAPINFNSGTLSHGTSDVFDYTELHQYPRASNVALLSSNSSSLPAKRLHTNGNGICTTFVPCDLSGAHLPLELSPRSKSRHYSYPYDPTGAISKSYAKDYHLSNLDRAQASGDNSDNNTQSPNLFGPITGDIPSSLSIVPGLPSMTVNGLRALPCTPALSDPNDDAHRFGASGSLSDHGLDQKGGLSDTDVPLPGFNSPESAFYQYQHRMEGQRCQVCGELAAGFHHGAYVCEACKKFFMRHSLTDTKPTNVCPTGGNCVVAKGSRGKCQICRYRKCLYVGMKMKDPETQPDVDISNIPCRVCGGRSSGFHFGALTCEGCKGFFRRTEGSVGSLVCVGGQNACTITPRSRNACKSCRFRRCLAAGMSKKGSRIGRQPNAVKFHCAIEIRQLRTLRASYGGFNDTNSGLPATISQVPYGSYGLDTPGSVSLQNRSDMESPKFSPETLTPTHSNKCELSAAWPQDDQKPPLSMVLLFPRTSDSIDVTTSSCSNYNEDGNPCTVYSPCFNPSSIASMRGRPDQLSNRLIPESGAMDSFSRLSRSQFSEEEQRLERDTRSTSDDGDMEVSPSAPLCVPQQTTSHPSLTRSILDNSHNASQLICPRQLSPCGYLDDVSKSINTVVKCDTPVSPAVNEQTVLTASLIASLAKRLAEEEEEDAGLLPENGDLTNECPPTQEVIMRFIDEMRTATEFLRLPNTYFKARFRMTSIPPEHQNNPLQVWNHMMNHFHMHAQQIVQFAKLVPGFNQLGITARSDLVRGAMYPVVLLLLSRDYQPDTDEYNYFDFLPEERRIIMQNFPTFIRFTEHLRMAGRLLYHLGLGLQELSLSSAVEILRNYQSLDEPTKSNTRELFILAHHSLRFCMTRCTGEPEERHRWAQLVALSKMIQAMNKEHHEILSALKEFRPDLHFPELYVEMFQLADSASAFFSASARAATLACSSALQSLAPLTLSLCPPASSVVSSTVCESQANSNEASETTSLTKANFLPTRDRWDASRLALAVPAAVAAVAAVAAAEASMHQSTPSVTASTPRLERGLTHAPSSSAPYFTAPSSFFFPTNPPPPPPM